MLAISSELYSVKCTVYSTQQSIYSSRVLRVDQTGDLAHFNNGLTQLTRNQICVPVRRLCLSLRRRSILQSID